MGTTNRLMAIGVVPAKDKKILVAGSDGTDYLVSRGVQFSRQLVAVVAATVWLATVPPGAAADPATEVAAVPVQGSIYVGNADDDEFSGVVDVLSLGEEPHGFPTGVDEDDGMAVGDLVGDAGDEVVVVGDDENRLDIHDAATGQVVGGFDSAFNSEEDGIAVADVRGDAKAEIVVADEAESRVRVYSPTGQLVSAFGQTGFDSGDRLITGDVTGDGVDEIIIVNDEDAGQIDAFDAGGTRVRQIHTNYQGGDGAAVGEVTGDLVGDIVVANANAGGRLDIHDAATGGIVRTASSAFDSDDKVAVGNVNGFGTDEIVVANTEDSGRLDVHDLTANQVRNLDSGYDGDDRFAVSGFGDGDLDGDRIPDRVELAGICAADGTELLPKTNPCRATIHVQIDHVTGADGLFRPNRTELDRVEVAFDQAPPLAVADCSYPGHDTRPGIDLRVEVDKVLPAGTVVNTDAEFDAVKAVHLEPELSPFVHYNPWVESVVIAGKTYSGWCCYGVNRKDFSARIGGTGTNQAVNFMHELGHAIGLGHGGGDGINFKPNYLSVMNYWFSGEGLHDDTIRDQQGDPVPQYDYSDFALPDLDESELFEANGIGADRPILVKWFDRNGVEHPAEPGNGRLDWTGHNADGLDDSDDDERVAVNLNADTTACACVRVRTGHSTRPWSRATSPATSTSSPGRTSSARPPPRATTRRLPMWA